MAAKTIPEDVRQRAIEELTRVAQQHGRQIAIRHRGRFLYIDEDKGGMVGPLCRLEYRGSIKEWGFAIYKYSDESYSDDEFFFPASGSLRELLEVALEAYP